ncbi:nucleotide sugar dehydrogenase [Agromyces sp. LHK192]|uniref:nucleotide sugar dehydrogenase n=1 Tax=Agromyces sp. LHK192 TaxID=2498704 RepID=UPI001F0CCAD6|nr:nucleotide sugar dehydrogenase [Agromyces sp. LHK192]
MTSDPIVAPPAEAGPTVRALPRHGEEHRPETMPDDPIRGGRLPRIPRVVFDHDVAIVGLGYVGLPTSLTFHANGARVLGIDSDGRRLEQIRAGAADLLEFDRLRLATALRDDAGFAITDDAARLSGAAAVVVCVPTPIDEHLTPDLAILRAACGTVVEHAVAGQLIVLTSTTYAGCTHDFLVEPLARRGLIAGTDVHVAFSPERIDPGNAGFEHEDVPRVVGGATPACREAARALLSRSTRSVHPVESLEAAEMTKLLENTFRAVNIALANEFAEACAALGVSVTEVVDAAATKPYGFMPFYPGPGVGGHCIPCDPHYLLWQFRKSHLMLPLIEQAMSEIAVRPRRVAERAREVLADVGRPLAGARVLVVGISYKPDVGDLRESPALEIMDRLRAAGADVGYSDPFFASVRLRDGSVLEHVADGAAFEADLAILHTTHSGVDRSWLAAVPRVLDTTYRSVDVPQRVLL